jgi:hypothetical protein
MRVLSLRSYVIVLAALVRLYSLRGLCAGFVLITLTQNTGAGYSLILISREKTSAMSRRHTS